MGPLAGRQRKEWFLTAHQGDLTSPKSQEYPLPVRNSHVLHIGTRGAEDNVTPDGMKRGPPEAVGFLLEEHAARVWRFALRLTGDAHQAEDLAQDALLRAWQHRWRLRDPSRARVWLFQITVNLWRDQMRRTSRRPECTNDTAVDQLCVNIDPAQALVIEENVRRTLIAMDQLPTRQREVLHLHACESLSLAEIAEILGIRTEAVKASLCLARKSMRRKLNELCSDCSFFE